MAYTPDPTELTRPTDNDPAESAQEEFRALKAYIASFIATGNWWNPNDKDVSIGLSGGNLVATKQSDNGNIRSVRAQQAKNTGKWYWEIYVITLSGTLYLGVGKLIAGITGIIGVDANGWSYKSDGKKINANVEAAFGAAYVAGDTIGIALDSTVGTLQFYKNNVLQGTAYAAGIAGVLLFPTASLQNVNDQIQANFGSYNFLYTTPSGFRGFSTPSSAGSAGAASQYLWNLLNGGL